MILIWLAFVLGTTAAAGSAVDYLRGDKKARIISWKAEMLCSLAITMAIILLTFYLYVVSASYIYVYLHSSVDLESVYRLSALWAGQEGSFLLWTWFILFMLLMLQYTGHTKALKDTRVMKLTRCISLWISVVFLMLLVLKNPFATYHATESMGMIANNWNPFLTPYPLTDGQGMNPLLRNPWMAVHPPVLFLGYAAFTVPFAAAIASLILNDDRWIKIARDWMRIAWFFMTIGIGLGGFWAYEVLGWGAWYWTWDPVETSSLIPWITATAYLHTQTPGHSRDYRFMGPFFAIATFLLVIFATFVTRSGMWVSVHSWQDFTLESMVIAVFLIVLVLISLILLIRRYFEEEDDEKSKVKGDKEENDEQARNIPLE